MAVRRRDEPAVFSDTTVGDVRQRQEGAPRRDRASSVEGIHSHNSPRRDSIPSLWSYRHFQDFVCADCGTNNRSLPVLIQHRMELHRGEDGHVNCHACPSYRGDLQGILKHLQDEHQIKLFGCNACRKVFQTLSGIWKHQQLKHEARQKFNCELCGKGYLFEDQYNQHKMTHQIYSCTICGSTFCSVDDLKLHGETKHDIARRT